MVQLISHQNVEVRYQVNLLSFEGGNTWGFFNWHQIRIVYTLSCYC